MNSILLFLIVLVAAIGVASRQRSLQLNKAQGYRDGFFNAANALANDERTPDIVLSFIEFLSESISSRWILWRLLWDLLRGKVRERVRYPKPLVVELRKALDSLPSPLDVQAAKLMTNFSLGITYNNFIIGAFLRRAVMFAVTAKNMRKNSGCSRDVIASNETAEYLAFDLVDGDIFQSQPAV